MTTVGLASVVDMLHYHNEGSEVHRKLMCGFLHVVICCIQLLKGIFKEKNLFFFFPKGTCYICRHVIGKKI